MNVSYPSNARPFLQMKHIDGPYLHLRDGRMHWLTLWEIVQVKFGLTDVEALEKKHWKTA